MAEATVRARLNTVVSAVSNIGRVYDYERWIDDWTTYLGLFKTTISGSGVVRGWTITCPSISPIELETIGDQQIVFSYTYKIRGYFGLDDENASEKAAILVAIAVVDALNADEELHGADYVGAGPHPLAELTVFEPRSFGDVLCHYAEITHVTKEVQE